MRKRLTAIMALCLIALTAVFAGVVGCKQPDNSGGTKDTYTITFLSADDTELSVITVNAGETPVFSGAYPTLPEETAEKTFAWEWDKTIVAANADATYKLVLKETIKEYTVKFYAEDGTTVLSTAAYKYGTQATAPTAPEKTDYSFDGWYTAKEGGEKVTDFTVNGNAEYYARYKENVVTFEVIFYDDDGTELKNYRVAYGENAVAPEVAARDGDEQYSYVLDAWYDDTEENGGKLVTDFTVKANSYYYARYKAVLNKYSVTFVSEGVVIKEEDVEYGSYPTLPEDPEKEGYLFAGWDNEVEKVTCDVIYTAVFGIGLSQEDVADFKQILNENPEGTFVLTEDLDFENAQTAGVITFGGILNGNGYALKNLLVHFDARDLDNWESYLFAENYGTIKNLGVYYKLVANGTHSSLIYKNTGTVSNVFVSVSVAGNDVWTLGTIASINDGGTVKNSVAVIREDSTGTAQLGSIVGVDKLSTITDCYAVTNGKVSSEKPNFAENGLGYIENCENFATMADLLTNAKFASENGWNENLWKIVDGELLFGHAKPTPKARVLTQADVANFAAILAETPDGKYELGGDIDFGGATIGQVENFSGTLDGKGYTLKNVSVNAYFIKNVTNTATIKNIKVEWTLAATNDEDYTGFIQINAGLIENVYFAATLKIYSWHTGPLAGANSGTIQNAVVTITKTNDFTELSRIGGIIGSDRNGKLINCYTVHNGILSGAESRYYLDDWGHDGKTNCGSYSAMAELAGAVSFEEANGWNTEIWENTGNSIIFGKKVSVEMEILGASIRYATASDSEAGIRFGVKLNMEAYQKYAAIEGVEMGMVVVPESRSEGVSIINLKTANAKKIVTFGAEGNKWGYYKENGVKVEGYVQSVVYVWGIPVTNYNDDLKVAAYIKDGDNVIYSETFSMCINEVALRALETETDEGKIAQLNAYINANEYTVEFKDGDNVMQTGNYHYGDTVTEPNTEKAGYTFIGWDKEVVAKVTKSVTYTAIYEEKITVLTDKNAFVSEIKANPNGNFELGGDIDFGGETLSESIVFGGTLDGKGYALKNFKLGIAEASGWNSRFISENNGTIKNIGLYITSVQANNNEFGFIRANKGTVSNVLVNFNYDSSLIINQYCHYGTIAMQNDGGTIENCVVNITVAEGVDIGVGQGDGGVNIFAAISAYNVNGGIIKNCHAVIGENNIGITIYPWATQENNATYATMAELAAAITFSSENGWNTDYTNKLFAEITALQNADNEISSLAVFNRGEVSCEDDRVANFAAEDLQYYFNLITGKTLNVKTVSNLSELEPGVKYFVLGKELAEEAALSFEGLTSETGYIVQKAANGVYLYGNTAYGTLNAVYAMLNQAFGLEIYTDEVYTADRDSFEYSRIEERTVFNPSIDKMWAQNGALTKNANFTYQRRLGYVNSWQEVNGTYHNFLEIISKSVYSAEHPEWFVTVTATDSKQNFETLCLTAGGDDMAAIVAKYARDEILAQDRTGNVKNIFVFGQPDARGWCDCSASEAVKNAYGANSAEYIIFMNKVAKIFEEEYSAEIGRKITFMLMAYNQALEAPSENLSELKLYDTEKAVVAAMVAMIEGNSYRSLEDDVLSKKYGHSNRYFLDQYKVWKSLGKAYYWRYSAYFDNYFVPLDTISNMQATYKSLAENGVDVLVDQGVSGVEVATDFEALKIYLKAKLAKDVNADVETLIKNFCNAYYGAGGEKMYEFLTVYRAWYKTLDEKTTSSNKDSLGCHIIGGMDIFNKKYWDDTPSGTIFKSYDASMLKGWYANYIEAALNLVDADSDYAKRIRTEGLFVRYMAYAVYGDSTYGDFVTIATDAKALGIERFAEGNAYVKSGSYVDGSIDNLQ